MEKTPKDASQKITSVIDHLNLCWDLQLPRSHGQDPDGTPNRSAITAKCSSWIKYLVWKKVGTIDVLLGEFEDAAKTLYSSWVFKPKQECGVLPVMSVHKPLVSRDLDLKRNPGLIHLTDQQREQLQDCLYHKLQEDIELAALSSDYAVERGLRTTTPSGMAPQSPQRRVTRQITLSRQSVTVSGAVKRELDADEVQSKKPSKKQKVAQASTETPQTVSLLNAPLFELDLRVSHSMSRNRDLSATSFRRSRLDAQAMRRTNIQFLPPLSQVSRALMNLQYSATLAKVRLVPAPTIHPSCSRKTTCARPNTLA
jgi:hypothetical protein